MISVCDVRAARACVIHHETSRVTMPTVSAEGGPVAVQSGRLPVREAMKPSNAPACSAVMKPLAHGASTAGAIDACNR